MIKTEICRFNFHHINHKPGKYLEPREEREITVAKLTFTQNVCELD